MTLKKSGPGQRNLLWERVFADVIKLRILIWRHVLDELGALNVVKMPF